MGDANLTLGNFGAAEAAYRQLREIYAAHCPPDDERHGFAAARLGEVAMMEERYALAADLYGSASCVMPGGFCASSANCCNDLPCVPNPVDGGTPPYICYQGGHVRSRLRQRGGRVRALPPPPDGGTSTSSSSGTTTSSSTSSSSSGSTNSSSSSSSSSSSGSTCGPGNQRLRLAVERTSPPIRGEMCLARRSGVHRYAGRWGVCRFIPSRG
jgi:hypothetical protein